MTYLFETPRLGVRPFLPEDAERMYENHREEAVRQWFPNECYADLEEAKGAAAFFADCVQKGELPYVLAVAWKKTGELIGDAGVNEVEGKPGEEEIGYTICEKYSGKGCATELVAAMTDYLFSAMGMKVLYGRVLRGNGASARVLEKNGCKLTAEEYGAEDDPYGQGMLVYKKCSGEMMP
jgi:ribosomal-protein-alanine N-acetyltransferase